jgi:hypothetical protein
MGRRFAPAPRCCRSSLSAPLPIGEIPWDTAPLVSLPLAVPFLQSVPFSTGRDRARARQL